MNSRKDLTICYYSANQESPVFEQKIIDNLIKQAGDIPIISVTRKPLRLGKNICIGEQSICYINSFRQLLVGLEEAKTEFCIAAESDCLYPPEYFQFTPPTNDNVYRYTNLWVHFDGRDRFWKKSCVEAAQMCDRLHWIKSIKKVLAGHDGWNPAPNKDLPLIFTTRDKYSWTGKNPVLYFKTHNGINFKTGYDQEGSVKELPYWGTAEEVHNKYLCEMELPYV